MSYYVGSFFSISMIDCMSEEGKNIFIQPILNPKKWVIEKGEKNIISCIGHEDTVKLINDKLGTRFPYARINISMVEGDIMLVAQYTGPRLPEGATTLPEGTTLRYYEISVLSKL